MGLGVFKKGQNRAAFGRSNPHTIQGAYQISHDPQVDLDGFYKPPKIKTSLNARDMASNADYSLFKSQVEREHHEKLKDELQRFMK